MKTERQSSLLYYNLLIMMKANTVTVKEQKGIRQEKVENKDIIKRCRDKWWREKAKFQNVELPSSLETAKNSINSSSKFNQ